MKLLIVQFEDTEDITVLPKGTEVTVGDGTSSLTGRVKALVDMESPVIEGDYHISPAA